MNKPRVDPPNGVRDKHVVVVGAGGNIGSHLVPLIGRLDGVARVTLVDHGVYEEKDTVGQAVAGGEVGRAKADVQADRLAALGHGLEARAIVDRVENVPLGLLRGDVILTGLDTRRARQTVNLIAMRLGMPWVDAGVDAGLELARVSTYRPDHNAPCLECGWDDGDYAIVEQIYSCGGLAVDGPATAAPAALGALAASWQALECRRVLAGKMGDDFSGRRTLIVPSTGRTLVSTITRNCDCRVIAHGSWRIERLDAPPERITVAEACRLGDGGPGRAALVVEGHTFVTRLVCRDCGFEQPAVVLESRLHAAPRMCPTCGHDLDHDGFDRLNALYLEHLSVEEARMTLADVGLSANDIFTIHRSSCVWHFELQPGGACGVFDGEGARES